MSQNKPRSEGSGSICRPISECICEFLGQFLMGTCGLLATSRRGTLCPGLPLADPVLHPRSQQLSAFSPRTGRSFWTAIGSVVHCGGLTAPGRKRAGSLGGLPSSHPKQQQARAPSKVCNLQSGNHPWHGRPRLVVGGARSQSGCGQWHTCSPLPVRSRALAGTPVGGIPGQGAREQTGPAGPDECV